MRSLDSGVRLQGWALAAALFIGICGIITPLSQAQTRKNTVNVNTADQATLETLPGVGPAIAQKISKVDLTTALQTWKRSAA